MQLVKGWKLGANRIRAAAIVAVVLVAVVVGLGRPASGQSATGRQLVPLTGNLLPGLDRMTNLGPAPADQHLQLSVAVAGQDEAGLQATYHALYTPGSGQYHRFLTPAQIADRFGAPTDRWTAVKHWLADDGLQVAYASGTRDLLVVDGTVAQIQRRFGVAVNRYQVGGVEFVANAQTPQVPADLGITSVLGLNTLERSVVGNVAQPGATNLFAQSPKDLWGAYEMPPGQTGEGQSVAIFGYGPTDGVIADLNQFMKEQGLPTPVSVDVVHVGDGPFDDDSGHAEWNIDTQAAAGMAPDLDHLTLYFTKDLTDASVAASFSKWVNDPDGPKQANASFGECEQSAVGEAVDQLVGKVLNNPSIAGLGAGTGLINELQPVADPLLQKATLEGRTLFVASGDTGSSCPAVYLPVLGAGNGVLNQVVPFTNYPATSPYVTSVGGTVLYTKPGDPATGSPSTRASEYAWTFGGGGDSLFVDAPDYQHGIPTLNGPCLATADGQLTNTGKLCRGVPDVAALSGDVLTNGYPIVSEAKDSIGGGTSLSSPLWAGMWARLQGAVGGNGQGFANQTLYPLGQAHQGQDFYDVTTGLLGLPLVGNGLYLTRPGWDYVTGWGPPRLKNLIADAQKPPATAAG